MNVAVNLGVMLVPISINPDTVDVNTLLGLVKLGFLEIIQVNKVKQNFVRSDNFETLLAKHKIK